MSNTRAFDHVKGLLDRLDRGIDAARARRLHADPFAGAPVAPPRKPRVSPATPSAPQPQNGSNGPLSKNGRPKARRIDRSQDSGAPVPSQG